MVPGRPRKLPRSHRARATAKVASRMPIRAPNLQPKAGGGRARELEEEGPKARVGRPTPRFRDSEGWLTVTRRKPEGSDFYLDVSDWDAPLLAFDGLAAAFDALGASDTLRGVPPLHGCTGQRCEHHGKGLGQSL